jgi:NTE family protein
MTQDDKQFDAVFEGGGVKGVALVGAYSVLEEAGYRPVNLAGTSAGAICAALLAAGYRARELRDLLFELDFRQFLDQAALAKIPLAGPVLEEVVHQGLYQGDAFLRWIRHLLADRGKRTFGDLVLPGEPDPRYRFALRVVAADLSRHKLLILPDDARDYGIAPESLEIAEAVRMSMSIPFFFCPIVRKTVPGGLDCRIVDGGVLSNFPVDLFDSPGEPAWPTFGFHLAARPGAAGSEYRAIRGLGSMLEALVETMLAAHDARYLEDHAFVRTIAIDTLGISTINFDLTRGQKQALYDSGVAAARDFMGHWDFERYKELYRRGAATRKRRDRVWR